jgi:hypothetical protein
MKFRIFDVPVVNKLTPLLLLLVAGFGCRTASTWVLPSSVLGYSDAEVFSGTWTNNNGRVMGLISSFVKGTEKGGDFLIAKIGDRESKEAYFCEIYEIKREEDYNTKKRYNVDNRLARIGDTSGSGHFLVGGIEMVDYTNRIIVSVDLRVNPRDIRFVPSSSGSGSTVTNLVRAPINDGVLYAITILRNYEVYQQEQMAYGGKPQVRSN